MSQVASTLPTGDVATSLHHPLMSSASSGQCFTTAVLVITSRSLELRLPAVERSPFFLQDGY